jgi:hypothetical protein
MALWAATGLNKLYDNIKSDHKSDPNPWRLMACPEREFGGVCKGLNKVGRLSLTWSLVVSS